MDRQTLRSLIEVLIVFAIVAVFLWFARRAFPGANALSAAILLASLLWFHRRSGDGFREVGFRWDTFGATARLLLPVAIAACALIVAAAAWLGQQQPPSPQAAALRAMQFVALGIVQQYLLVGFFFRRFVQVAGSRAAPALTALVFAALHLPNAFLTLVTLIAGYVACLIYRRSPNLWANGLAHGLLACLMYYALPRSVTGGLRVGAEYLELIGR